MGDRTPERKKDGQEAAWKGSTNSYGDVTDPYDRAKRLWHDFLAGRVTGSQLDEFVSGLKQVNREKVIGELFNGKI